MADRAQDQWARWVLHEQFGGHPDGHDRFFERMAPIRERVLDNAAVRPGGTVLDVGCGSGLIAFGALERVGATRRVIFGDVSEDLLDHCRAEAGRAGVLDRWTFLRAPADDLSAVADDSIDAVTTRSVLIDVDNKHRALDEFRRVLRPGGDCRSSSPSTASAGRTRRATRRLDWRRR
jgi:ubiquinone/menaquinone biosynthesis C-methylase UbiE